MRIGIDLGGTKIEAIALASDGSEIFRKRVPTPSGNYAATIDAIAALVAAVESATGQRGSIGVAIPGTISAETGLVKGANSVCLIGRPLEADISAAVCRPVRLANDANCFAISESVDGAAREAEVAFGVILGTGCGGATVVRGKDITGRNAIAGEWGHNPLPWQTADEYPGPDCYCGKKGCVETFLSGTGIARDHAAHYPEDKKNAVEIFTTAANGDLASIATVHRFERRLAKSLAMIINIIDPDVIVLGGGVSNVARLYAEVPRIWGEYVFSDIVTTPLKKAVHGDSSGVRGAAWLWPVTEKVEMR